MKKQLIETPFSSEKSSCLWHSFQCEFGSAIFRKAKFNQQKVRPFDGRPSVSCSFSGAIAQFPTPWSMLLGVIPIANGPKQDTTRRDEMKPVNDEKK